MSGSDSSFTKSFITVLVVLGLVFVLLVVLSRLVTMKTADVSADPMVRTAVLERIKPMGQVKSGNLAELFRERSGAEIYGNVCASCHDTGSRGSPKKGDNAEWQKRMAQGQELMLQHALQGYNKMPARGGDDSLSDDDVKKAINHLLESVGVKDYFVLPKKEGEGEQTAAK